MSTSAERAARLAAGSLDDVPLEVLRAGLRLPLHEHLGLHLVGLHPAVVELRLTEQVRTFGGPLHGGVVATLADVAAGVCAATSGAVDITRYGLLTTRLEVDFRAQPRGEVVRAEAEVLELARRAIRCRCRVLDDTDRSVATAVITTRPVPRAGVAGTGLDSTGLDRDRTA